MSYESTDFNADVIARSHTIPVVVDFWAPWCAPCKVLSPILERLAERSEGRWVLVTVNTDEHQDLAAQFTVRGIPAVRLFVDGHVAGEFSGAVPESALVQWLRKSLPDPHRKKIEQAERMLDAGEHNARAFMVRIFSENVLKDARVVFPADWLRAVSLVEGTEEHSPIASAIRTVAGLVGRLADPASFPADPVKEKYSGAIAMLGQNRFAEALEALIGVIRSHREYDDDGARRACVAVFTLLGENHPVTLRYRREFSSALY
jgi:putative thioredoxin